LPRFSISVAFELPPFRNAAVNEQSTTSVGSLMIGPAVPSYLVQFTSPVSESRTPATNRRPGKVV